MYYIPVGMLLQVVKGGGGGDEQARKLMDMHGIGYWTTGDIMRRYIKEFKLHKDKPLILQSALV